MLWKFRLDFVEFSIKVLDEALDDLDPFNDLILKDPLPFLQIFVKNCPLVFDQIPVIGQAVVNCPHQLGRIQTSDVLAVTSWVQVIGLNVMGFDVFVYSAKVKLLWYMLINSRWSHFLKIVILTLYHRLSSLYLCWILNESITVRNSGICLRIK